MAGVIISAIARSINYCIDECMMFHILCMFFSDSGRCFYSMYRLFYRFWKMLFEAEIIDSIFYVSRHGVIYTYIYITIMYTHRDPCLLRCR